MTFFCKKILLITLLLSSSLFANIAKVVALKGEASIIREGKILPLTTSSKIYKHDEINTNNNTKVQLLFVDNTIISIGKNSSFQVFNYVYDEKNKKYEASFSMAKGTFRTITGNIGKIAPKKFNLKTKAASIGIRGTQIVLNITAQKEDIFCTEGKILVQNILMKSQKILNAGEFVTLDDKIQKIDVKKITPKDIHEINQDVSIENNLATDTITLQKKNEIMESSNNDNQATTSDNQNNNTNDNNQYSSTIKDTTNLIDDLSQITPESFFENHHSVATYKGDFNNYTYDKNEQYLKVDKDKVQIPTSTSISMDIDFGATKDHISNGLIDFKNSNLENMTFEGEIKKTSKAEFSLKGTDETSGSAKGNFYGNNADLIKGIVDFKNDDIKKLKGQFDATKQ